MENETMNLQEVMHYLRLGRLTILNACKQGVIPYAKVGKSGMRFRKSDIDNLFKVHNS